ncbi:rhodanese-like domain-containing protein [Methylomarinovum caldicuralii]|uniref:rhodanese-like domain-containing protein n=1 Tax=Methylomarinovum caldicuralii TaxID=438856 RepID=UPI0029531139|nr:rhodanese-like domain-containing protein [Methylomarinovum caldicuralii]
MAATPAENEAVRVGLTKNIERIEIKTATETFIIERIRDPAHTIPPPFDKTSRPCPPYCIQPIRAGAHVETLGELETISWLQKRAAGDNVVILDVRLPLWRERGTLPLALNLPLTQFQQQLPHLLERHFGARHQGKDWDYAAAKTLVLFSNGPWDPDAYEAIQILLAAGYPPERIKWYRGGMQSWLSFGLTTVQPQ